MYRRIKCTKEDLLRYIHKRGMVENWEIDQKYRYADGTARHKLNRLKKQGLVINLEADHWELTVDGIKRLRYYAAKNKK
jgi:hypothetical protein